MSGLDSIDQKILQILTADARTSISAIARRVHKSRTAVESRIERLEAQGIILGYTVRCAPDSHCGPGHTSFMQFVNNGTDVCAQVWDSIKDHPGVLEAYSLFGNVDMLVRYDHVTIGNVVDFKETVLATGLVRSVVIMPVLRHWQQQA